MLSAFESMGRAMIDIRKQVAYWRDGATEDWAVAHHLVTRGNMRHGFFFAHLALEKALKAHVCAKTGALAPRIHNLVRLAKLAGLQLAPEQATVLARMNAFVMAGRYPELQEPLPEKKQAADLLAQAEEVFLWLTRR
jgi:HEPN domain-containing protein